MEDNWDDIILDDELIEDDIIISENDGIIEDGNALIEDKLYKIYKEKTYKTIDKIIEIGLPETNQQIRLITMKSFNTIAFIELIAHKEKINNLILVIFAINYQAAQSLIEMKNQGLIKNIELIVSSVRNAGYSIKSKAVELLSQESDIKMCFVNSHAKISAIETNENFYIIEGSGNYSYNGRIEQYVIDNDKLLFDFTKTWIEEMKLSMQNHKDFKIVN